MSESKYNFSNRDLAIFFMVTFGFTIVMGIAMAFAYTKYNYPVDDFALVQMYYPTIGVMTALLLNKERHKNLPMKFYKTYLSFTIVSVILVLVEIFIFHQAPSAYSTYLVLPASICLALIYFSDEKENINRFGLGFSKNIKASIGCIVLYIILRLCVPILISFIFGDFNEVNITSEDLKALITIFLLPLSFPLDFIIFLGEEYGWRYFLQTALQERLGKRIGVILVGFIWGIWHFPLNLFYYSPAAPFYSVINHIISCTGSAIFLGFVYMKTKDIWAVSIIHFMNNSLVALFSSSGGVNTVPNSELVLKTLIYTCIVYVPFLFSKEYRKTKEKTLNYTS
ncbi:CPBP family intramembrane glutamic endopeptidase [Clostridium lundense]|uniref:CPBP family intramembrane glutamic endopeptidase n=1 Tax=Clostridium lundense TaxID=319475 RepID=UPI00047FBDCF|nr:type II CAAX endopeptidase family protein [Clostridium lundense]